MRKNTKNRNWESASLTHPVCQVSGNNRKNKKNRNWKSSSPAHPASQVTANSIHEFIGLSIFEYIWLLAVAMAVGGTTHYIPYVP